MRCAAKAALCSGLVTLLGAAAAQGASMGLLAPHNVAANSPAQQQWLADPRSGCRVLDNDVEPGDSITWSGQCALRLAWSSGSLSFVNNGRVIETITGTFSSGELQTGHVTAFWADGSKYDGNQTGGEFDGQGVYTSATGDKLEGQWRAGGFWNGHGTVTWANGDKYDGEWKNGKSDGQGTEVWADGHRYEGLWAAGKPVNDEAPTVVASAQPAPSTAPLPASFSPAAPVPASAAPAPPASVPVAALVPEKSAASASAPARKESSIGSSEANDSPLGAFIGSTLYAVDGGTVEFSYSEDGLGRAVTLPNGTMQEVSFAFMNARLGTVTSDSTAVGVFRTSPGELDIDFEDGTVEVMKAETGGGLVFTARTPDGETSCTDWYPQGHVFAEAEKRAAVQEYAARLGVAVPAAAKKGTVSKTCGGAFLEKLPPGAASLSETTDSAAGSERIASAKDHSAPVQAVPVADKASPALQSVAVRPSEVQPIEAPAAASAAQPTLQSASFTVASPASSVPPANAPQAAGAHDSQNASRCLSVVSNGQYWGFENSCGATVQFTYCEMSAANPLTSCQHASVAGSVAANGFSSLVADRTLAEQDAQHEFRWLACEGGAGEVVPHLDSVDPPTGRCLRAVAAAQ